LRDRKKEEPLIQMKEDSPRWNSPRQKHGSRNVGGLTCLDRLLHVSVASEDVKPCTKNLIDIKTKNPNRLEALDWGIPLPWAPKESRAGTTVMTSLP
jgi:hypothetical protein